MHPDDLLLGKPCLHVNYSIIHHIVINIPTDEDTQVQVKPEKICRDVQKPLEARWPA